MYIDVFYQNTYLSSTKMSNCVKELFITICTKQIATWFKKLLVPSNDIFKHPLISNLKDSFVKCTLLNLGIYKREIKQEIVNVSNHLGEYKAKIQKVANLEYVDFFKWFNNRDKGIPGFVMVDPVNSSAEYVELSESMK